VLKKLFVCEQMDWYRLNMVNKSRVLMEGLDIAMLCPDTGLIERVDGFFGHPTEIGAQTLVPESLRPL
jgi:hypothetical protein